MLKLSEICGAILIRFQSFTGLTILGKSMPGVKFVTHQHLTFSTNENVQIQLHFAK